MSIKEYEEQKKAIENDIKFLKHDVTYDIDFSHHEERIRIIKQKEQELIDLIVNQIPF